MIFELTPWNYLLNLNKIPYMINFRIYDSSFDFSVGYTSKDLILQWKNDDPSHKPVEYDVNKLELAQFKLVDLETKQDFLVFSTGNGTLIDIKQLLIPLKMNNLFGPNYFLECFVCYQSFGGPVFLLKRVNQKTKTETCQSRIVENNFADFLTKRKKTDVCFCFREFLRSGSSVFVQTRPHILHNSNVRSCHSHRVAFLDQLLRQQTFCSCQVNSH